MSERKKILERNPYHGIEAECHEAFFQPTIDDIRTHLDDFLAAKYWIPRREEVEQDLQSYKEELLLQGRTIEDDIRDEAGDRRVLLTENRFPYDILGCEEHILWILDESNEGWDEAENLAQSFLESRGIPPEQVVCYENNRLYQTANGIRHFRILLKG